MYTVRIMKWGVTSVLHLWRPWTSGVVQDDLQILIVIYLVIQFIPVAVWWLEAMRKTASNMLLCTDANQIRPNKNCFLLHSSKTKQML